MPAKTDAIQYAKISGFKSNVDPNTLFKTSQGHDYRLEFRKNPTKKELENNSGNYAVIVKIKPSNVKSWVSYNDTRTGFITFDDFVQNAASREPYAGFALPPVDTLPIKKTATKKPAGNVPLTKAGKPDKRFVNSVGAKSKVTGKAPTKRLQTRRAKPRVKGYSANPVQPFKMLLLTARDGKQYYYRRINMQGNVELETDPRHAFKSLDGLALGAIATLLELHFSAMIKAADVVTARANNPVPPSKVAKMKDAIERYEDFTGNKATFYDEVNIEWPDVGLKVGQCDGILYTTNREGRTESYIHKFKPSARPTLIASYDGKALALIGGNYTFTNRGIVDDK